MDVKKAINQRRSIRKYQNKEIEKEKINELIHAARLAPSGCNVQPTKLIPITDKKIIDELKKNEVFHQDFIYTCPLIMVFCGDVKKYEKGYLVDKNLKIKTPEEKIALKNKNKQRCIRDVTIASSFMVLRAQELGLGSCYIGWLDNDKLRNELNIPKNYIIPYVITFGYSDESPEQRPRKDFNEIFLQS